MMKYQVVREEPMQKGRLTTTFKANSDVEALHKVIIYCCDSFCDSSDINDLKDFILENNESSDMSDYIISVKNTDSDKIIFTAGVDCDEVKNW